jgi:para-nitrobenzyl esterase
MKNVRIKYGEISGIEKEEYTIFKGIPYAKPPIGNLRWKAPQEPDCWEGVLQAEEFSKKAIQDGKDGVDFNSFYGKEFHSMPEYEVEQSEDCLYLNVWTPIVENAEKLPVMVWFHGGGFMAGYGSEMEFDGAAICNKNTILVTVNHRLGIFGFLAHPWLTADSSYDGSGNYGFLDQIAALKWVKENIACFGGDPFNVCIFGQSAGCMSIEMVSSSPLAKGLFQKAILQSGIIFMEKGFGGLSLREAEDVGIQCLEELHANNLEELRNIPADRIFEAGANYMGKLMKEGQPPVVFVPVIDNYFLLKRSKDYLADGTISDIPYMVGSTSEDLGGGKIKVGESENSIYEGCLKWAQHRNVTSNQPAYVYYFTRKLPGSDDGAFHSAELWYVFGTLDRCWRPFTEEDKELSERIIQYWTNFAKSGNPNGTDLIEWKAYKTEQDIMELDVH